MWQCIPDVGSDPGISMDKLYGILDELRNKHMLKFKRHHFFSQNHGGARVAEKLGNVVRNVTELINQQEI